MNEELYEAIEEFVDSCHRNGHHNTENNIRYFLKENDHMNLDEDEVRDIFYEVEEEH